MKPAFNTLLTLILFSIAMGFLETSVVIYLRKIYYPEGFHLPLKVISLDVAVIELLREAATIIMLITIALLAGRSSIQRFAFFLICFGIWDIFYYVFLKLFLDWPSSIFEGDVLFLIPLPWFGPVLAPCILSLTMISLAGFLLKKETSISKRGIGARNILLMITGSSIIISSFIIHFKNYVLAEPTSAITGKPIIIDYNWWLFIFGEILILSTIFLLKRRKEIEIS